MLPAMRKRGNTETDLQSRRDQKLPAVECAPAPALPITDQERALFAALFGALIDQILAEPNK